MNPYEEVVDPETSAERLAEIAVSHPDLRPWIVEHPNSYDGLREWIAAVAAENPSPAQAQIEARPPRSLKKMLFALGGGLAAIIGVVSIAVPLISNAGQRSTSSDTIDIANRQASYEVVGEVWDPSTSSPVSPLKKHWFIPADAPFETFPEQFELKNPKYGGMTTCSTAQFEWLKQHALPRAGTPEFSLRIHNEANTGGALPIGNIRFEGKLVDSVAIVHMYCNHGGEGGGGLPQPMYIGIDGKEAVYGETVGVTGDVKPEGSPVTINVKPGEVASVTLTRAKDVDRQRNYSGRFLADVIGEDGKTVTLAEEVDFRRDEVPGYRIDFDEKTGGLLCMTADFSSITKQGYYTKWNSEPCTTKEVVTFLKKAAKSIEK